MVAPQFEPKATARALAVLGLVCVAWLASCGKSDASVAAAPTGEALQIDDPKLVPAARALDKIAAQLENLAQRAEAAQADRPALVQIRAEYQAALAQGRAELGDMERRASPADRRTLNAYYLQVVAPPLGRLQPLLFPALLVELPRGATPAESPTPTAAAAPTKP